MKILCSIDDGGKKDIEVARLLKKYGIKGLFFIPSNCDIGMSDIRILSKDFDIGGHTRSHFHNLKELPYLEQLDEIKSNKLWLESVIGKEVKHFCYPRGRYSNETIEAVKEAGFETARTTLVGSIDFPIDNYKIATTAHIFQRKEYGDKHWFKYCLDKFDEAKSKDGFFHFWCHSKEIDKYGNWGRFENLLKYINQYGGNF